MINEALEKLEKNQLYSDYIRKNRHAFLAHVFVLLDEANKDIVQIGYYNEDTDKIVTFVVGKGKVSMTPEAEVFKEQKEQIRKLDIKKVGVSLDEALSIADELQKKKYKEEIPVKKIVILQHLPLGQVWNITYVTATFKTLNIKVNSSTGKVVEDKIVSLVSF